MGRFLRVWVWRSLLLMVGSGVAAIAGVLLAEWRPRKAPHPPLIERWLGNPGVAVSPDLGGRQAVSAQGQANLSAAQRQKLQAQLAELQRDFDRLRDRTRSLEAQLGTPQSQESLEMRLQALSGQLQASPRAIATPVVNGGFPAPVSAWRVTLPSDALFQEGSVLKPNASAILDNLVVELQSQPGGMIQIAGHTDDAGEALANRDLSFRQATVVQGYLAKSLNRRYHLSAVGYGESRPLLENSNNLHRQRNRRLEIAIIR